MIGVRLGAFAVGASRDMDNQTPQNGGRRSSGGGETFDRRAGIQSGDGTDHRPRHFCKKLCAPPKMSPTMSDQGDVTSRLDSARELAENEAFGVGGASRALR